MWSCRKDEYEEPNETNIGNKIEKELIKLFFFRYLKTQKMEIKNPISFMIDLGLSQWETGTIVFQASIGLADLTFGRGILVQLNR